jgi:hypothetical protein
MREQRAVIVQRRIREKNTLMGKQKAAIIKEDKRTCYFLRSLHSFTILLYIKQDNVDQHTNRCIFDYDNCRLILIPRQQIDIDKFYEEVPRV